jgi:hypothetical protein
MKTNYEYTKDDYKKFLLKGRIINNIVLFIIGIVIYLYFSWNKISLIYLLLYVFGLALIIVILNILYIWGVFKVNDMLNYNLYGKFTLEITPNKFSLTVNKIKTDYKYKQIKKIVEKKNSFILKFNKSKDSLIFEKKNFNEKDYIKAIEMFKEKMK